MTKKFNPQPKKGMPEKKPPKPLKRTPIEKKPYKINKVSKKQQKQIVQNKEYYQDAIQRNIKRFNRGECICENCGTEIPNPTGRNVSHVIGAGANIFLYHDPINNFILCFICEGIWTDNRGGSKGDMAIFPESERRKEELTLKYYTNGN